MFMDAPLRNERQLSHSSQASNSGVIFWQLMVFASMRAQVVLPTPRGPQNKNAWASWLFFIAFFSVPVTWFWPTTRSEEHTSELQSLMRISYAVSCLKKKITEKTKKSQVNRS